MSQTNDGPESSSAESKIRAFQEKLNGYEKAIGLVAVDTKGIEEEILKYINITKDERRKMSPEECEEARLVLKQFSYHIASCNQNETAMMHFVEDEMNSVVMSTIGEYKNEAYFFQDRRELAIANDEHAKRLKAHYRAYKAKVDKLAYLSNKIDGIADAYDSLSRIKRKEF